MQSNGLGPVAHWGCNETHPSIFSGGWPEFDVNCEAALLFDRIGPKSLHSRARLFTVKADGLVATDLNTSRQSKDVKHPA
jgi:hypothetical protein